MINSHAKSFLLKFYLKCIKFIKTNVLKQLSQFSLRSDMSTSCQSEYADSSSDDEKKIMQREWNKNLSAIEKVAFREGTTTTDSKSDVMFQMGFDNGYKDGFKDGYKTGSYKSTIMLLDKFNFSENNEGK